MKIATLVTVVALATGSAFAAQNSTTGSYDRDTAGTHKSTATATSNDTTQHKEGFVEKTKRAFHRMGEKIRGAGRHDKDDTAANRDTRSMGAAGSDMDSARQRRMDDAYANYKSKQQK